MSPRVARRTWLARMNEVADTEPVFVDWSSTGRPPIEVESSRHWPECVPADDTNLCDGTYHVRRGRRHGSTRLAVPRYNCQESPWPLDVRMTRSLHRLAGGSGPTPSARCIPATTSCHAPNSSRPADRHRPA